jgi:molybdate transport system substrate-binding protein
LLILAALAGCGTKSAESRHITVGAAANLTEAAQTLGAGFESQSGVHVNFSFASTAQLASQIENGAPYDVYLAADAKHVDALDAKRLLVPGSSAPYAEGVLALWIPNAESHIADLRDLGSPEVRVIALAKPELAPYGAAAVEALQHAGLWDAISARVVYAENISQAKQFGASGNADAVFTAYSLVLKETGKVIQVDQKLYAPILQKLGVPVNAPDRADAEQFAGFMLRGKGRQILTGFGYR